MTCEMMREMARRRAAGEALSAAQAAALEAHLAECAACRAEVRFEETLALTIRETPTVAPPRAFAERVLAALPKPVDLPEPSFREFWAWVVGGFGLAAGAAWAVWHLRKVWLGWLFRPEGASAFDITYVFSQLQQAITTVNLPLMPILLTAIIGIVAWGATALFEVE